MKIMAQKICKKHFFMFVSKKYFLFVCFAERLDSGVARRSAADGHAGALAGPEPRLSGQLCARCPPA